MKIRFRKNTIRYRLDQIDVKNLNEIGSCEEQTDIPPNNILFSLKISEDSTPRMVFDSFRLDLSVPALLIAPILEGSQVGFECSIQGTANSVLNILVERDFKCLVPRGEEDTHAFDNPLDNSATC